MIILFILILKFSISEQVCYNATLSYLFDNCISCPTCGSASSGSLDIEYSCANQGDILNFNISFETNEPIENGGVYRVKGAYLDDPTQLIQNSGADILAIVIDADGAGDFEFSSYNILLSFTGNDIIMNDGIHAFETCFNCYDSSGMHNYVIVKSTPSCSLSNHMLVYVDGVIVHACGTITLDFSNNRTFDFSYENEEGLWKFALYLTGITSNEILNTLYDEGTGYNKHINNVCFDNNTLICEVDDCTAQFVALTERIIFIHDFFNGGSTNLTISIVYDFLQGMNTNLTNIFNLNQQIYDCTCGTNCDEWYDLWMDCKIQNRCQNTQTWNGTQCVELTCWELSFLDVDVCSGNGVCSGLNDCICRDGYEGGQCNEECGN